MNTNKKIKKLNIKVKVKPRPDLTNSETENSAPQTPAKITGFERAKQADSYWCSICNEIVDKEEVDAYYDRSRFEAANYYTDKKLAEWCNRSDILNRKMRRWAAEHNTEKIEWGNEDGEQYFILYDHSDQEFKIYSACWCVINGNVYFDTYDNAEAAIAEFGDEVKWLAENRPEWF